MQPTLKVFPDELYLVKTIIPLFFPLVTIIPCTHESFPPQKFCRIQYNQMLE